MRHISKFFFSVCILLLSFLGNAQEEIAVKPAKGVPEESANKKDSIPPKKERYGLRVGVDLFKLTRSFMKPIIADWNLLVIIV